MGKYMQIFKASGAGAAGGITAIAGFLLLGMAFGIPGAIIVMRENKKPKEKRTTALLVIGFILMIIGVALGLGFNSEGLMNSIGNQF